MLNAKVSCGNCQSKVAKGHYCTTEELFKGLPDVTYSLLAVVYGSGRHFTADIRYNMNAGSKVFFHYDPFHFRQDRVLALDKCLPACSAGKPTFLPRHSARARTKFAEFTHLSHVASVVYGITLAY